MNDWSFCWFQNTSASFDILFLVDNDAYLRQLECLNIVRKYF